MRKTEFCAITPTRGDRPELLKHCRTMMMDQVVKPTKHYIIDYKPLNDECDIIPRIKQGLEMAKNDGFEYAFIIEDDDYYPVNYFLQSPFTNFDFVGIDTTIYYHLQNSKYCFLDHNGRSSLFCTGFKISALDNFVWPVDNYPFLDIALWEYAKEMKKNYWLFAPQNMPIGIKHNIGKSAGSGHNANAKYFNLTDENNRFLLNSIYPPYHKFYINLKNKLQCTPA